MVLKNHYSRWAFAKVLLALPLIVFLLMLNCKPKPQEIPVSEDTQTQTTEVTETVADEAIETDNSKKEVVLQLTDAGKKQQAEDEKIIREKREKLLDANCWDHKKFRADLLKAFPQLLDKDGKINLSVTHDKANSCVIYSQKNYKRILEITRDECLVFHFKELNGYKMPEDLRKVVQENHNVVPIVTIAEGTIFTWADDKPDNDPPIRFAEVMPEPIGGMDAMYKFLQENLVYPANAKENNVGGRVFIEFVVGKDGTISNAKIIAGAEPKGIKKPYDQVVKDGIEALNAEALRVINLLPKWKPGTQMGKPVKCFYQIPIQFTIQ